MTKTKEVKIDKVLYCDQVQKSSRLNRQGYRDDVTVPLQVFHFCRHEIVPARQALDSCISA